MRRFGKARGFGPQHALSASRLSAGVGVGWLALTTATILADQIRQLPPRPPTAAERAAATPGAQARWRTVSERLAQRLPYSPPEFGAVWASRSGRICGVVTRVNAGVSFRVRFYTERMTPVFASEDPRQFFDAWMDCVGDHWVDLRVGSDALGFCAVPRNRTSVIAAAICPK